MDTIKYVRGNDILLKVWLEERTLQNGVVIPQPLVLDDVEELHVTLVNAHTGNSYVPVFAVDTEDANCLNLDIDESVGVGMYGIEVTLRKGGRDVRSYETGIVQVVETNGQAPSLLTPVGSCPRANVKMTVQMVSSAAVRGKNAYEMWLELPGNEGKTLQEYIDEVLDLAAITSEAIEATDGASNVDASLDGTVLTITDRDGVSHSVDTMPDVITDEEMDNALTE